MMAREKWGLPHCLYLCTGLSTTKRHSPDSAKLSMYDDINQINHYFHGGYPFFSTPSELRLFTFHTRGVDWPILWTSVR